MADVLFSALKLAKKSVKKALTLVATIAIFTLTAQPMGVLAAETTENANISENSQNTVQIVLKEVCEDRGYGETCAKHLLGMLWKESRNISTAVGDHGLALGYFQIHYRMHGVSSACATDLKCSANWTLDYLETNSYPKYVSYAIQCHNGCNIDNGYSASAQRLGNRLWNQPMAIANTSVLALAK